MPVIEFAGVGHTYPGIGSTPVLRDVTCRLAEHRVGIVGANGSGKSTFVRMLNALVVPSTGTVRIDGLDTARDARAIRRRVGFCFSDPDAQIVMPTVAEDVAFSLRRRGLSKQEIADRVAATLAAYELADHHDHPAHLLSSGQKQLLALAAVLVTEPDLVVMDEPTTLLDLGNIRRVRETIRALPQQVVLVTHHLELLDDVDRALVLHEGRIAFDGEPAEARTYYEGLFA
ncbi:putative ABC transporter ATP-binding protein DR_2469 [Nostocoides japonicum T1-X7]|uniref:Putative ABC transporter ATP-binding protein DR_2469 n=1 Tax=Nostocoides japonicum T1-X7 TaxID=1194083 RepID=A0A077LVJ6_9MICO|nr:ABC transporter ATP-binding protein [Tetrasphaera japonica]CCH77701.1 putative ABC transporter ATP-binding protein DR_2469 [Tetrasphaera japonica T1-X7]